MQIIERKIRQQTTDLGQHVAAGETKTYSYGFLRTVTVDRSTDGQTYDIKHNWKGWPAQTLYVTPTSITAGEERNYKYWPDNAVYGPVGQAAWIHRLSRIKEVAAQEAKLRATGQELASTYNAVQDFNRNATSAYRREIKQRESDGAVIVTPRRLSFWGTSLEIVPGQEPKLMKNGEEVIVSKRKMKKWEERARALANSLSEKVPESRRTSLATTRTS